MESPYTTACPSSANTVKNAIFNFYRRFIPRCAEVIHPLTDLLRNRKRKNEDITFTTQELDAFNLVKEILAKVTLLAHPKPDAPLSIVVDASDHGVGGVLQQQINDAWQPLAFFLKKLQPAETKYSTFGRELLAAYLGINRL